MSGQCRKSKAIESAYRKSHSSNLIDLSHIATHNHTRRPDLLGPNRHDFRPAGRVRPLGGLDDHNTPWREIIHKVLPGSHFVRIVSFIRMFDHKNRLFVFEGSGESAELESTARCRGPWMIRIRTHHYFTTDLPAWLWLYSVWKGRCGRDASDAVQPAALLVAHADQCVCHLGGVPCAHQLCTLSKGLKDHVARRRRINRLSELTLHVLKVLRRWMKLSIFCTVCRVKILRCQGQGMKATMLRISNRMLSVLPVAWSSRLSHLS